MSKRQFKSQASSGRAGNALGGFGGGAFATGQSSTLSYIQEPPEYATIADANVVVAFKNLSKKDDTTKAKALEDLQSYLASVSADIEDGFLDAWARLFPRLSIDNSRRVRQLAHILNGQVCVRSGKRTAKHLPRTAGPWLAGTFDNDRTVSRAASEALSSVFTTTEKIQGLRKAFQKSILEYARDAILHETVQTLSDERTVSADDAQATYARVVATSLSLTNSLLNELPPEVIDKETQLYEEILRSSQLWEFVSHADSTVRRAVHRLVQTCLAKRFDLLEHNAQAISSAYVYKGLQSDQTGSALDFLQTLEALTTSLPTIWTDAYTGKKSAALRFRHFLKKGSQSAPTVFWDSLTTLIHSIPSSILPTSAEDTRDLLSAARSGVSKKEERFNASAAWPAYFSLAELVTSNLSQPEADPILDSEIMPLVRQYVSPEPDTADWTMSGGKAAWIVSRLVSIEKAIPLLNREWPQLAGKLVETAQVSQPEQSKDFDKSQRHVATTGERWADLQRELWSTNSGDRLQAAFLSASHKILGACIDLLKARNAKPYGAAAVIEQLLRTCGQRLMKDETFRDVYTSFATSDLPQMIFSPSQRHLIHGLYSLTSQTELTPAYTSLLQGILSADQHKDLKLTALRSVFTASAPQELVQVARSTPQLDSFLVDAVSGSEIGSAGDLFTDFVKLTAISDETTNTILSKLTVVLSTSEQAGALLPAIETLSQTDSSVVNRFASRSGGTSSQLLPSLLKLEGSSNDEISEKAAALSSKLSTSVEGNAMAKKYHLVLQNLEQTSPSGLPVEAVIELASRMLGPEKNVENAADVLPSFDLWLSAVRTAIRPPVPSLALLSPLGGVIHLLTRDETAKKTSRFDTEGFSQALRMAMYTTRVLVDTDLLQQLGGAKAHVFALLHLIVLAAEDNLSVPGSNDLFSTSTGPHGEAAVLDFTSEANKILNGYWSGLVPDIGAGLEANKAFSQLFSALEGLSRDEEDLSPLSYYSWLSYSSTVANLFEIHGSTHTQVTASETILKDKRSAKQLLPLVASVSGMRHPLSGTQTLMRFANELVSDLTDLDIATKEQQGLEKIILLNVMLHTQEDMASAIAKQRLVFLVKGLMRWLNASMPHVVQVEVCKALTELLSSMHDLYGEHWEQALSFLVACWTSDPARGASDVGILLMNASLKLLATLRRLSKTEEPNDDLIDALKDKSDQIRDGLIRLLTNANDQEDEANQPLMITHELLARQLEALPPKPLAQADELYPLLYSSSRPIMQAAFDMLHAHIPAAQEQISFDAALDNKSARLPDELLSLVLEAPTLDSLADASFDRMMPISLQGYLYSWRLLFDHFDGSSFRVKNDYVEQLKEDGYLVGLLDLTFDFLGHSRGKPVDVSKLDVQHYVADTEPSPEREVQWLLAHLYFLALTHLPSLVKSYYLGIRSRQTSLAVETWTGKHLSPLITTTALQSVAEWAEKSAKEDPEYENLTIKVGMRSKEVYVSYLVDEQTMAIKVVLPDAYPLASAQVVGVSRVAVREEKWQSWLRNCQGVITFSNGSIIDGLTAWRKNVTGALKGQTECAICYSIISADKQLPTKRCPTCKNLFHSSCLLKWFKTSNASTCPLCRNPFNFN